MKRNNKGKEGEKTTIFVVETYVVRQEKQAEFKSLLKRYLKFMKENPTLFKEMKSWKLFTQTFGSISDAYVELIEYDSLADREKWHTRSLKDKEFMKIRQEAMTLIDATTFSRSAWEPVT